MNNKYILGFKGKEVSLFDTDGKIIRKFRTRAHVVNAVITSHNNNPAIAISTNDGKFELYKADGTVIKRG